MVLTPGYIKIITKEIALQIIRELKKPLKKPFSVDEPVWFCKASYSDKEKTLLLPPSKIMNDTLMRIENERKRIDFSK